MIFLRKIRIAATKQRVAAALRWCLAGALALGLGCAAAQDLVSERAYFEDSSGKMELAQVIDAPFQTGDSILSRGVTRSAIWLRFVVVNPPSPGKLTLRVLPATMDELTLYAPPSAASSSFQRIDLGAWPSKADYGWTSHGGSQRTTYYLRVASSRSMALSVQVLDESGYRGFEIQRGTFFGGVLAAVVIVMLGLLALYVQRRDPLNLLLGLNLSASFVLFLAWFGYWNDYSFIASLPTKVVYQYISLVDIGSGIAFHWMLLKRFGLLPWMRKIAWASAACFAALFVAYPFLEGHLRTTLSFAFGGGSAAVLLMMMPVALRKHRLGQRVIGGMAMCFQLATVYAGAALLGLLQAQPVDINLPASRMLLTPILFGLVAWMLDHDLRGQLQLARINEDVSKRLVAEEVKRRQMQERFMTMLMHEVKTPLSIIQLATASVARGIEPGSKDAERIKNIDRAVDDLNGLVERCGQADRLAEGAENVMLRFQSFTLQTLIGDLLESLGAKRIDVRTPGQVWLKSDYQYLRLVLLNLLSNGLKYSAPGSTVLLRVTPADREGVAGLEMRVENKVGPVGYPDPKKIFSRYYRAEAARSQMGAGLGLWLSQEVARQLGTEISLRMESGVVAFMFWTENA
jgi:signal transduction histidine kinase